MATVSQEQTHTPKVLDSAEEAKEDAVRHLSYLVEKGKHEWQWAGSACLKATPAPSLPVRLFADSARFLEGGWGPCLAMMAGKKFSGRYWQYVSCDTSTGEPHPPVKAVEDIERLIDAFVRLVRFPKPDHRGVNIGGQETTR